MTRAGATVQESLIKRWGRFVVFHSIDAIGSLLTFWRTLGKNDKIHSPRNVLLIQLSRLGDMLLSTPLISSIKRTFPNCALSVVCTPWAKEAIRDNAYIDEIYTYEAFWEDRSTNSRPAAKHFVATLRLITWLRKKGFNLCFVVSSRTQPFLPMFGRLSGAPVVVGFSYKLGDGFLTHKIRPGSEHVAWENLRLLKEVFPESVLSRRLFYSIRDASRRTVKQFLQDSFAVHEARYLCITPTTAQKEKLWRENRWAELIDRICDDDWKVVLAGTKDDIPYIDQILSRVLHKSDCVSFSGKGSLNDLSALIEGAQGVITCESLPMHLAGALDVACVVLFSRIYDYEKFLPLSTISRVLVKDVDCAICMKGCLTPHCMDFTVDEVYGTVMDILLKSETAPVVCETETR
jgi:ADP-heptose:LPS heptosyltransferase